MASATYNARVLVLRKTKLGESDLVLTMLSEDGSQIKAVAKGARKPQSSFASRLELYSVADVLNASGRNLDIVKEARLVESNEALRGNVHASSAAACMVELVERLSQASLPEPHMFDLTCTSLAHLGTADEAHIPLITAGHLLKALAFSGFRPCLDACVSCSRPLDVSRRGDVRFSVEEGGALCDECAYSATGQVFSVDAGTLLCARELLRSTFDQIEKLPAQEKTALDVLQLCQRWCAFYVGAPLKSLRFFLTLGEI